VYPEKASLLKKAVHRGGHDVSHPGDGPEGIGPGTQVSDFPQVFEGVALLLHGVGFGIGIADYAQLAGMHFNLLIFSRAFHQWT
jgi:hypothetical protein